MTDSLRLTVRAAEKRDAGRGIARLPEAARQQLGLLSGDTVLIEGERETVAKLWPARGDVPAGVVRIDADSRANAGVKVGDTVRVAAADLPAARRVTLRAPAALADVDVERDAIERLVGEDVRNRPVAPGDQLHLERLSGIGFTVDDTDPDGRVRVTEDTDVRVVIESDAAGHLGEIGQPDESSTESSGADADESASSGASVEMAGSEGKTDGTGDTASGVAYEDIGGLDEELDLVRETVELPLSNPELFARLGIDPPKGVLLHGPPGTGKTMLAKAVANESDHSFLSVKGPEIFDKHFGESEQAVRDLFRNARGVAPALIFFDEFDSIAAQRGGYSAGSDVTDSIVNQLLAELDGMDPLGDVIVIAATNRVDMLDPAVRRPGRFSIEIPVSRPDEAGRGEIFQTHLQDRRLADEVDPEWLARVTDDRYSGADIAALCDEAAMTALRGAIDDGSAPETMAADSETQMDETPSITRADFQQALARVDPASDDRDSDTQSLRSYR